MIKLTIEKQDQKQPDQIAPLPIAPERIGKVDYRYVAISLLAIGLAIGFVVGSSVDRHRDNEQIVEPDGSESKGSSIKIEAEGSTFVFVYEFQTKTADQELLVRDLRAWSAIKKCSFRQFDQDSKDAEPYKIAAEKAGLKSPFMAVVRDKKIVRVFDWPRDRLALESLVK